MPIEGGTPIQLTFSEAIHRSPAWSSDNKQLAFGSNDGGNYRVGIMSAAGGAPKQFSKTQLSTDSTNVALSWSPGSQILYQKFGNRNFLFLDPVTEEERPLVQDESVGWIFHPRISPDGMKVAVSWNRRPNQGIWVITLANNSATFLPKGIFTPIGWSPDGSMIYMIDFSVSTTDVIWALPAGGGAPKPFLTMPGNIKSASVSSDGKKFVCSLAERKSDVWVVENFDPTQKK